MGLLTLDGQFFGLDSALNYRATVDIIPDLRNVTGYVNGGIIGVQNPSPGQLYMFDDSSVIADDGDTVVQPTGLAVGRWLKITGAGGGGGSTTYAGLLDTLSPLVANNVPKVDGTGSVLGYVPFPKNNYAAVVAPSLTDDIGAGYEVGSSWIDNVTGLVYICTDNTAGAAVWKDIVSGGGGVNQTATLQGSFVYNTVSPLFLTSIVSGQMVLNCEVTITVPFDDPSVTLQVGSFANPSLILASSLIDPTTVGVYGTEENFPFLVNDSVILTLSPGLSTQGSGYVVFQVKRS